MAIYWSLTLGLAVWSELRAQEDGFSLLSGLSLCLWLLVVGSQMALLLSQLDGCVWASLFMGSESRSYGPFRRGWPSGVGGGIAGHGCCFGHILWPKASPKVSPDPSRWENRHHLFKGGATRNLWPHLTFQWERQLLRQSKDRWTWGILRNPASFKQGGLLMGSLKRKLHERPERGMLRNRALRWESAKTRTMPCPLLWGVYFNSSSLMVLI